MYAPVANNLFLVVHSVRTVWSTSAQVVLFDLAKGPVNDGLSSKVSYRILCMFDGEGSGEGQPGCHADDHRVACGPLRRCCGGCSSACRADPRSPETDIIGVVWQAALGSVLWPPSGMTRFRCKIGWQRWCACLWESAAVARRATLSPPGLHGCHCYCYT